MLASHKKSQGKWNVKHTTFYQHTYQMKQKIVQKAACNWHRHFPQSWSEGLWWNSDSTLASNPIRTVYIMCIQVVNILWHLTTIALKFKPITSLYQSCNNHATNLSTMSQAYIRICIINLCCTSLHLCLEKVWIELWDFQCQLDLASS